MLVLLKDGLLIRKLASFSVSDCHGWLGDFVEVQTGVQHCSACISKKTFNCNGWRVGRGGGGMKRVRPLGLATPHVKPCSRELSLCVCVRLCVLSSDRCGASCHIALCDPNGEVQHWFVNGETLHAAGWPFDDVLSNFDEHSIRFVKTRKCGGF